MAAAGTLGKKQEQAPGADTANEAAGTRRTPEATSPCFALLVLAQFSRTASRAPPAPPAAEDQARDQTPGTPAGKRAQRHVAYADRRLSAISPRLRRILSDTSRLCAPGASLCAYCQRTGAPLASALVGEPALFAPSAQRC